MSRLLLLALLSVIVTLSACYRWSAPRPVAPSSFETRPARLRVTLGDGRQLVLRHPILHGDSLMGDTLLVGHWNVAARIPVALPLANVRSASRREFSLGRTALLAGGITVAAAVLVTMLCIATAPGCGPGGL